KRTHPPFASWVTPSASFAPFGTDRPRLYSSKENTNFHQIRKNLLMRQFRYRASVLLSFALAFSISSVSADYLQAQQPARHSPHPVPPPPKADTKDEATIAQLVAQLNPKKLGWISSSFWQHSSIQRASLVSPGESIVGPDDHLRTEMTVKLGKFEARSLTICDGTTVWKREQVGKEEKGAIKWDLKAVRKALETPGSPGQLIEQFYRVEAFLGLSPLSQALKQELIFTNREPARWENHDVVKLTGVWSSELTKGFNPSTTPWPLLVPRKCYLFLGTLKGKVLWPY